MSLYLDILFFLTAKLLLDFHALVTQVTQMASTVPHNVFEQPLVVFRHVLNSLGIEYFVTKVPFQ